jgi:hypothetical protein
MSTHIGDQFDEKQLIAIEAFATGSSCTDVATLVGVDVCTISRWRANPCFVRAIVDKAKDDLRLELPEIYKITAKNAKSGSSQHIKIILDHLDNLERLHVDKQQKTISFTWATE